MHKGTSYDGSHNSAKSIIHSKLTAEQICGHNTACEQHYGNQTGQCRLFENECALHIVEGVNQKYRDREGDENGEVIILDAAGGAAIGLLNNQFSLLGSMFLPGGPIAGAIVGGGLSILSQTESFKSLMFGKLSDPNDPNSKREGGLISDKMKASFTKALPFAVGGGVVGGLSAILKGALGFNSSLGVLGMQLLPGGILGGALLGAGMGILKNSESFKTMLFGEKDEDGKRSGKFLSNSFNKASGIFGKIVPGLKKAGAGLGIGALTGAVMANAGFIPAMFSLGGPVGMGIAGLGIGIASSTEKFNDWMFGTKDPETGERRKDGLLTRMTNLLQANVIEPIGDAFKSKMLDLADWTREKITYPFRLAFGPILDSLMGIKDNVVDFVKEKFEAVGNGILDIMKKTTKMLFSPLTKALGFVGKSVLGIASTGAKLAISAVSVPLQGLQLLTAGKRRKEYVDYYKNYYGQLDLKGALRDKWAAEEAETGKKKNIFAKMSDTVGTYLGQGEIADSARAGWNDQMTKEGKNHLLWRNVPQERRELRSNRKKRRVDEKQWAKIDKLRRKIINDDLDGRYVELTDYQFNEYRDKFKQYGISDEHLQSSKDIMDLLYNREEFKKKLNPAAKTAEGVIDTENPEQKAAREKTSEYQDTVQDVLIKIGQSMGAIAKDFVTEKNIKSATDEWNTDKKELAKRLKKARLKNFDINNPELQDFNIKELDDDMLKKFRYSKFYSSGDAVGFMKTYGVTQKSKAQNSQNADGTIDTVVPESPFGWDGIIKQKDNAKAAKSSPIRDFIASITKKMDDLIHISAEHRDTANAELQVATGGKLSTKDATKRRGKSFGARIMSKFSAIGQLLDFKKKQDAIAKEKSDNPGAADTAETLDGEGTSESSKEYVKEPNLLDKVFGKMKSIGALLGSSSVGGFLLKAAKFAGGVGVLGGLGLTVAELICPGTSEKIGASIDAFTNYVTSDDFSLKKVFNDFSSWFNTTFIGDWWNNKVRPWWTDTAQPWLTEELPDIILNAIPSMIGRVSDFVSEHADTLVGAFTTVITEVGVPLATAVAKATPEILSAVLKGSWQVLKSLGTSIFEMITGKKGAPRGWQMGMRAGIFSSLRRLLSVPSTVIRCFIPSPPRDTASAPRALSVR